MFRFQNITKSGFNLLKIENIAILCEVAINPSGAALHSFSIVNNNESINVIDYYSNKGEYDQHLTSKGFRSCKLSPFACRIKNAEYDFDGELYKVDKFLLGENAIHGLIYDAVFTIVDQSADEESATLILKYEYRGEENGYPFHFDCIITYQLIPGNQLVIKTEIINRGKQAMPIQDGWHPYFTLGKKIDELDLQMNSIEQVVFNDKMIPTGKLIPYAAFNEFKKIGDVQLDDCFRLDPDKPGCTLRDAENKIQVEIRPDSSYPWLQLYTPPHRQSIAIENLSAPPDTFNNKIDLKILSPGEKATFTTTFKITCL